MPDEIELTPTPASVAQARRWSAGISEALGFGGAVDTIGLLVSELVSNVVLHARTACRLRIAVRDGRLRVEVVDGSSALPGDPPPSDPMALSGRGIQLVSALSTAHGAEALPGGGKVVWFEVAEREQLADLVGEDA
jgi:anti-sigma regulatory factor (Ser/Thr protein kinase)